MKSNFDLIRSHLEYGHKVEGVFKNGEDRIVFVGMSDINLPLSTVGNQYWEHDLNRMEFLSITPIPHRYKKLEVGTKVDVLEGHGGFDKHNSWELRRYCEGEFEVELFKYPWTSVVPFWAITPHVEGKVTEKQFRKKPVIVTAHQSDQEVYIDTLEGKMKASKGDWIVTGIKGEKYPVKPDIFEETYELVENLQSTSN